MNQMPKHLPETLYLSGKGFVMGVMLGLSGVVASPIRGEYIGIKITLEGPVN